MKVMVTQNHINRAIKLYQRGDKILSLHCPISLAIKDKIHRQVKVGYDKVKYLNSSGIEIGKELPEAAKTFICNFDRYVMYGYDEEQPEPITFNI